MTVIQQMLHLSNFIHHHLKINFRFSHRFLNVSFTEVIKNGAGIEVKEVKELELAIPIYANKMDILEPIPTAQLQDYIDKQRKMDEPFKIEYEVCYI